MDTINGRMQEIIGGGVLNNQEENNWLSIGCLPLSGSKGLEIRTALQLSANILPFWICTFPLSLSTIGVYWCIFFGVENTFLYKLNP